MRCPNCESDYLVEATDSLECPSCNYTEDKRQLTLHLKTTEQIAAEQAQLSLFKKQKIERRAYDDLPFV